ncbi:hypothetical protein KCU95_g5660, partial [Aureobasidium melanogenum]
MGSLAQKHQRQVCSRHANLTDFQVDVSHERSIIAAMKRPQEGAAPENLNSKLIMTGHKCENKGKGKGKWNFCRYLFPICCSFQALAVPLKLSQTIPFLSPALMDMLSRLLHLNPSFAAASGSVFSSAAFRGALSVASSSRTKAFWQTVTERAVS